MFPGGAVAVVGAVSQSASRAFCFAAPKIWKDLPKILSEDRLPLPIFKRNLQTFYLINLFKIESVPVPRLRFFFSLQYIVADYS